MKNFLIIVLVAIWSISGFAQTSESYWGAKVGLNVSEIREADQKDFDTSTKSGLYLEAFRNFRINDVFAIQAGLNYSEKGGKDALESIATIDIEEKFTIANIYLGSPVVVQVRRGNFFSELGFEPSFRLNTRVSVKDSGTDPDALKDVWEGRDFDLSFIAGVGYHINNLEFSLRVVPGLTKLSEEIIFTDENGMPLSKERYGRNMVINISVGYRL